MKWKKYTKTDSFHFELQPSFSQSKIYGFDEYEILVSTCNVFK